jgi:uncharacterized protein
MDEIRVERNVSEDRLRELGVRDWPIWTKEESEFPWFYDEEETCYFLEGDVVVTPKEGAQQVRIGKGDLVTFPRGMSCHWDIHKAVRKHYHFS